MPGPYVQLAAICEKVLQEGDGVLSLIRVIDRLTVTVSGDQAPEQLPGGNINATLVVALRPDDARGRHAIRLRIQQPSGIYLPERSIDVNFEGEDRGVNLVLEMQFEAAEGLFWIEVSVEAGLLTRVPLRVIYQRIRSGT